MHHLHGTAIDSSILLSLCASHPKELSLSGCTSVTDKDLKPLFEQGEIESLSLSLCPRLTDLTLELIASHLRKLRSLDLANQPQFTDHSLSLLLASCPKLESLSIHSCEGFTDSALFAIALFGKQIRTLRLSANKGMSEKGFIQLPKTLESLNISSNPQLSNRVCQSLIETSPHLRYLDLSFCNHLSSPISDKATQLQILNLQGCTALGDPALETISTRCPQLTHLFLAYSSITDLGLQKLAERAPHLKVLDLSRCQTITDAGIEKILSSCTHLQQFNIFDCPLLSEKYHSFLKETA